MKKVSFGAKPASGRLSPDAWVHDREDAMRTKRLTIDVPLSLHTRIKSRCAVDGLIMADVIRELLEGRFPAQPVAERAKPLPGAEFSKHDES